jgi:hypothetical protein
VRKEKERVVLQCSQCGYSEPDRLDLIHAKCPSCDEGKLHQVPEDTTGPGVDEEVYVKELSTSSW